MAPIATEDKLITAQELFEHPEWGRCELVLGKVVTMSPAGAELGSVAFNILLAVGNFVKSERCGVVFTTDTGCILSRAPDTVRGPDVMYLSSDRVPAGGLPKEYLPIAPDMVAEVISPNDRMPKVLEKTAEYLSAGVKVVWLIDPHTRTAEVHRSNQPVEKLSGNDRLRAEELLPGFSLPLNEVFES